MNRQLLFILIVVLAAGAGALGFWYYQEQQRSGVEIRVGPGGVSIEGR